MKEKKEKKFYCNRSTSTSTPFSQCGKMALSYEYISYDISKVEAIGNSENLAPKEGGV